MSVAIPANTSIIVIDTRLVSKTITLPYVTLNPGRVLFLKDYYGTTTQSTLTITVQGSDLIDDYNTTYIFSNNFGSVTFISDGVTSWRTTGFYDGGLSYVTNIASFIPPAAAITLSLSSPSGGSVTITPSNYAVSYIYYINTSTSIVSPTYSEQTTVYGSPISFTTTLRIGILYYAIVVPYNAVGGAGPQAASTSAFLAITPGSASITLTLNNPTSGSVVITPAINAETYDYYISTDTTIGNAIYSASTAIVNTPVTFSVQFTGNVPYYAIVVAVNPYTSGPQSVSDSSTIFSPTAITVTFSAAVFNGGSFDITAGLYATSYTYYLTTSSSSIASPLLIGTTTQTAQVNFFFTYPTSTTYYIIVIPINSFGEGPQAVSNGIAFTIVLPLAPTVTFNSLTSTGGQFTASFVNNASYYTYYISTTTSPANAVYTNTTTLNILTVNFTLVTPLLTNTDYYVLVVPVNGNGSGSQGTSSPLSFTLPSGGSATFTSVTYGGGNLQIAASANATFYNYYISTSTSIANSIYSWTTTLTGVAIPINITLQGSTTYYAIVIPYNIYGEGPQFISSAVSFTLPSGGSVVFSSYTTTGGTLTITASTDASLYTYYISTSTTIENSLFSDITTTTGSAVTFSTTLQGSTTYYIIVVPSNSFGPGLELISPPISFILPSGGSVTLITLTGTGGSLQITAATNATSYSYYISTTLSIEWAAYSNITSTTGSTVTFSGASFASDITYYAIVVPTNIYGPGLQVVSNSTSINLPSGGAVVLSDLSYTGGSILITPATNATSYTYYISFTQNILDAVYTSTTATTGSLVAFTATLLVNEPYYAIIIPTNAYGQSLEVVSPPTSFNLPSPTTIVFASITSSGGTIIISPSLDATAYTYYISLTTSPALAVFTGTTTVTGSAISFTATLINQESYYALVMPTNNFGSGPVTASNGTYFILPFGGSIAPPNLTTTGGNITIIESSYASYYMYYISIDTTIANAVYSNTTTVTGSPVAFVSTFQGSTDYYAIIVPMNSYGPGAQFNSTGVSFTLPYGGSVAISSATTAGGNITIVASTDAISYSYYISTDTTVENAIFSSTTTTTGSAIAITQALTPGTSYYAVVVPVNSYGSGPQFTYNFILPSGGSVVTSTLTPAGGNITITASTDATSYEYYISPDTTIGNAIFSNTTSTTGSAIAFTQATTPGTNYYVIVVPLNSYGSGLQFTYNFILPLAGTATITALTTIGGNITVTASAYATSYNYYISTDTTITNAIFTSNTATTDAAVAFSQAITPGIIYYALVVPINFYGSGPQFTLSFILPSGGSVDPPNLTTSGGNLTISASTGATSYTYYISTTTSQANSVYSNTTTTTGSAVSFSTTLQGSTTYYALVVPTNTNGLGAQFNSSGVSFTLPSGGSVSAPNFTDTGGNITITASADATSYNYYISPNTTIASAIFTSTTTTTGSPVTFIVALQNGINYYAIVVPVNTYGIGIEFMSNSTYLFPSGGSATIANLTPSGGNITITASTGATSYTYYINTSVSIVSPIYTSTTTTTGSAVAFSATLQVSTTYYVIVVPTNSYGSGAQFSSTGSSFVLPAGGSVAISGATTAGGNITITAGTDTTSYNYYISTDTTIGNAFFSSSTSTTGSAIAFTQALTAGITYYAIVVPFNIYGSGPQFTSTFILPSGGSVAPPNLTSTGGNITITASANATSYTYYINTSVSTVSPTYTSTTTTTGSAVAFSATLLGSTTYYVIVIPTNTYGSGAQFNSSGVSFTLPSGGSVAISGATTAGGNITITASTNATSYNYYISPDTTIGNAIFTSNTATTGSPVAFTQALTAGITYYAIVIPLNAYGSGPQFTSSFILPSGGSVVISTLTTTGGSITITASANATSYTYYINTSVSTVSPTFTSTTPTTGSAVSFSATFVQGTTYYAIVIPTNVNGSGTQFSSAGFAAISSVLYTFTGTLTFTPAGATGRSGPTLSQCTTTYSSFGSWVSNTAYFNMTQAGYQRWTVPATRNYTIVCAGAKGGNGSSGVAGSGFVQTATFSLTQGHILSLLIGQLGGAGSQNGSGGGGTFIFNNTTSTLLMASGGGGGGYYAASSSSSGNMNAVASTSGQNGIVGNGGAISGVGGTGGNGGGTSAQYSPGNGGGGGGYTGNGSNSSYTGTGVAALSYTNGGTGGINDGNQGVGGFGGGGGAEWYNWTGAGGGGGYSGGGGGVYYGLGGGGGSFSSITRSSSGANSGNGYVSIT